MDTVNIYFIIFKDFCKNKTTLTKKAGHTVSGL